MTKLHQRAMAAVGTAATLAAVAGSARAQACGKDADCPGETVCEAGVCVGADGQPAAPAAPAATPTPAGTAPSMAPIVANVVDVHFVSRGDAIQVKDFDTGSACVTPCTLAMSAGQRRILIGTSTLPTELLVPNGGGRFSVNSSSSGALGAGIALIVTGTFATALGGAFIALKEDADDPDTPLNEEKAATTGLLFLIPGLIGFSAGVALVLTADLGGPKPAAALPFTPVAAPLPGGGYLGVRWSL